MPEINFNLTADDINAIAFRPMRWMPTGEELRALSMSDMLRKPRSIWLTPVFE